MYEELIFSLIGHIDVGNLLGVRDIFWTNITVGHFHWHLVAEVYMVK